MLFRSHRGGVYYTPENTMPAFRDAMARGYAYIETDPCLTKDGKVVLMHDRTINRTCRNPDGSAIGADISCADLTYCELCAYDAGIYKGEAFRGTRIPLLSELLSLTAGSGTVVALDKKIGIDSLDLLCDVVAESGADVSFSCADLARIRAVQERFPDARIDYDGPTTEEDLRAVTELVRPDRLLVWVYLDKPNFSWLVDRDKASRAVCERVKRAARLGIANVNTADDVYEAIGYDPYIVEV